MKALALGALLSFLSLPAGVTAQEGSSAELGQAKSYFRAGAAAYEMGDYLAAIQALEAAYRITPLPAIAFSLAQAERRQYFVSRDRAYLARAIELFRTYLAQVHTGGRRADATDALGQLEPLAALGLPLPAAASDAAAADKTRVLISSTAPAARAELDGGPVGRTPLIVQVVPGVHRVRVLAPGYFDSEREVEAIAGELIPVEVTLRERPASVLVRANPEAELHIDGSYAGRVVGERRWQLSSGAHRFDFARNGHELERVRAEFEPGVSRTIATTMRPTAQRTAAITLFVASGVALATGAVLSGFAIARENAAQDIAGRRASAAITPDERAEFAEATRARDRWRFGAGVSFAASLASVVTGLFLYTLDQPDLRDPIADAELQVGSSVPGSGALLRLDGRLRF